MDFKSQFASLYKTDMSIDNLRAKVARRKSITQKENRHKEFRKSRGLALVDANISVVKEQDLTALEEANETFHAKGFQNKSAVPGKSTDTGAARRAMLQRFREEKQLRKLKEQREKASKGIFRCGLYKPETSLIPVSTSYQPAKVKPKEKPAPPPVTRVTRSAAKIEVPVPNTRSRPAQVPVLNKVSDRMLPKGRGQTSFSKKNENENQATAIPSTRTTRAMAAATSRLPTAKGAVKNTSVTAKPQKRTKDKPEQTITLTRPEKNAVLGQVRNVKMKADATSIEKEVTIEELKLEVVIEEEVTPVAAMEEELSPEAPMEEKVTPEAPMEEKVTPEAPMEEKVTPEAPMEEKVTPEAPMEEKVTPEAPMEEKVTPEAPMEEKVTPEAPMEEKVTPEAPMEEKVTPEAPMEEKVTPEAPMEEKVTPEAPMEEKVTPEAPMEEKVTPEAPMEEKVTPEAPMEEKVTPEAPMEEKVTPEAPMEEKVTPEAPMEEKVTPEAPMEEKVTPEAPMEEKVTPEAPMEEKREPEVAIKATAAESKIPTEMEVTVREERKPSFAPENFVFQPLDGLANFKFQPMTPKRANAFLTPTFTWSPVDGKSNFVFARDLEIEENKVIKASAPDLFVKTSNDELKMDTFDSPEAKGDVSTTLPFGEESLPACKQNTSTPTDNPAQPEETQHNVPYFRSLLKSEIQRLSLLCSEWDERIDQDIPEDAKDLIRTTVGQTRLLITERFKQFEGLVDNCEFKLGEKETTCTDLAGFWDMIFFQIEDVSKKFVNLKKLEENSWQQTTVQAKKVVVRKKNVPAANVPKSQGDNGRAAARSRLAAIKAAMRNRVKQEEIVEEPSVSEQPMQVDPVVFDAGFFRIESPAKLPGSRRSKARSQSLDTPKSTKKILLNFHGLEESADPNVHNSGIPVGECADHILHNSGNPVGERTDEVADHILHNSGDRTEEGADHMQAQKSPNPAKSSVRSSVRKALFDTEDESVQSSQSDSVVIESENTGSAIVPQVVDLTKYLIHTRVNTENVADSPVVMELSMLETELEEETKFEITSTVIDDVFMCSPEKVQENKILSPKDGTVEILPDEGLQNADNPLDFLGGGISNMVTHTPLKSESVAAVSDLIMFSPMEM